MSTTGHVITLQGIKWNANSRKVLVQNRIQVPLRSKSLFFVEIVIPRYLQPSTIGIFSKLRKKYGCVILMDLLLKHKEYDFDPLYNIKNDIDFFQQDAVYIKVSHWIIDITLL